MRVALLFPNLYETERLRTEPIIFPLSLGYLSAVLKKAKHEVKVFDAAAEKLPIEKLVSKIKEFNPEILGITTNISTAFMGLISSRRIKKALPHLKIIMGGPWATSSFEYILENNFAEVVVLGEGEQTITELVNNIDQQGDLA